METNNILLVEDNEGDIVLTLDAFEENNSKAKINVVRNGEEALDFLFSRGQYKTAPKPNLVLLDINLPVYSGLEVLDKIKSDDDLRPIPVIMLTTSSVDQDIEKAYRKKANSYVVKPIDMDEFVDAISGIEQFWLNQYTMIS